jgi:hypothetical protein
MNYLKDPEFKEKFAQAFVECFNAPQAALSAGAPRGESLRISLTLLKDPAVQAAIQGRLDQSADREGPERRYIINQLVKETCRMGAGAQAGRLAAWRLIGMHLGMFRGHEERKRPLAYIHFGGIDGPGNEDMGEADEN